MDQMTREQSGAKVQQSPELDPKFYGFSDSDWNKEYPISEKKIGAFLTTKPTWTLKEIDDTLHKIYCGKVNLLSIFHLIFLRKDWL